MSHITSSSTTISQSGGNVVASQSVAAAGSASGSQIIFSRLNTVINCLVTNGATGPTLPCEILIEIKTHSAASFRELTTKVCTTTALATHPFTLVIPKAFYAVQVTFSGHTGQAVTVECTYGSAASAATTYS